MAVRSKDGVAWASDTAGIDPNVLNDLYCVVWSGTQWAIATALGTVLTSPDGAAWSTHATGARYELYSMTWTGSQFVAVGGALDQPSVLTSPDGAAWTARTPADSSDLFSVLSAGGRLIAFGDFGAIETSGDGTVWTGGDPRFPNLSSLAWNGNLFAAVGDSGAILTSRDGVAWTRAVSGTKRSLRGIAWSGSGFAAVGDSCLLSSPDGIAWTDRTAPGSIGLYMTKVIWAGNQFVAVGSAVYTSPDGSAWTFKAYGPKTSIAWNGSRLVTVGTQSPSGYVLSTSTDGGDTWDNPYPTSKTLNDVTWAGTRWIAVGMDGTVVTSADGKAWTVRDAGLGPILFQSITWTGSLAIATGFDESTFMAGANYTSPDGLAWSAVASGTDMNINCIISAGSRLAAVGDAGLFLTSP